MGCSRRLTNGTVTHAEFMSHRRVYHPIPRQQDIGLRRYRLGQLQEPAGRLGQALCRNEDGLMEILRQR